MPKIVDHDQYRQSILKEAFSLFVQQGYQVSMRQIAAHLQVSTGTLYHYFPNKEVLFMQTAEFLANRDLDTLRQLLLNKNEPAERFSTFADQLTQNAEELAAACILAVDYLRQAEEAQQKSFKERFILYYLQQLSQILNLPYETCALFMSAIDGLYLHYWIDPDKTRLNHQINQLIHDVLLSIQMV